MAVEDYVPVTGDDWYERRRDDAEGRFFRGVADHGPRQGAGGDHAARDHLWLTEEEWKALVPEKPRKGDKVPLPPAVAERVLRFHLVDNTRGEPPSWRRDQVRSQELTLTVEEADAGGVGLR